MPALGRQERRSRAKKEIQHEIAVPGRRQCPRERDLAPRSWRRMQSRSKNMDNIALPASEGAAVSHGVAR